MAHDTGVSRRLPRIKVFGKMIPMKPVFQSADRGVNEPKRFLLCALFMAAYAADGDFPNPIFSQDFEADPPVAWVLSRDAVLTREPDRVLSGKRSLAVDTTPGTNVWNEFLTSPDGLFKPGGNYHISFDYRWIQGKADEARLYALLRSKSKESTQAPDIWLGGKSSDEFSGGLSGRLQKVLRIRKFADYYLVVGVKDKGALSIDNLKILEVAPDFRLERPASAIAPGTAGPPPHAQWIAWPEISDEFNGDTLDRSKWRPDSSFWSGRPPAYFDPRNVTVRDGQLQLTLREADYVNDPELADARKKNPKFNTWTSASVEGISDIRYGYFEIKARIANASCSSAFWFTGKDGTEIDVFEIGGNSPGYETILHSAAHVFPMPWNNMAELWGKSTVWDAFERLADGYHLYGLEWDREALTFYLDGKAVGRIKNTHWNYPLKLLFDIETMPGWLGVPNPEDSLPATYHIDYVRAWRRADTK